MQLELEDDNNNNNISPVSSIERVRKQYTPKNDAESMDAGSDFEQYAAEAQARAKARAKARIAAKEEHVHVLINVIMVHVWLVKIKIKKGNNCQEEGKAKEVGDT